MSSAEDFIGMVYKAKEDSGAADALIDQYFPFIRAETAKFIRRHPIEGQDEELSVAMFAFYESIMAYDRTKGAFISLASRNIRNRLIDYQRKEARHRGLLSLDQEQFDEGSPTLLESLDVGEDEIGDRIEGAAAQGEIAAYVKDLAAFGLGLSDVADSCPKQDRTLTACHQVLAYAKKEPDLLRKMLASKQLPVTALAKGSGVNKRTIDRHRDYLVALLLAYTNGFELIRGHLQGIQDGLKGGERG